MARLIDDGIIEEYTVVGFWFESLERWANTYEADTALAAEEMAQAEARSRMLHLGVVGVFKGRLDNVDGYATWIDPYVKTQEEMDMIMEEAGYWRAGQVRVETSKPAKKRWFE